MAPKRMIRLKELRPDSDVMHTPSESYLLKTDGTLSSGPFRARADEDGFLITGNDIAQDSRSMVFVGDSFVESIYCDENNRFVSTVERNLSERSSPVRCLNAGYSGSTLLHLFTTLLNKLYSRIGPGGYVVLFASHSDSDVLYGDGSYWNNSDLYGNIIPNKSSGNPLIPKGVAAQQALLRGFISTCLALDLKVVLATTPHRMSPYEDDQLLRSRFKQNRARFELVKSRRSELNESFRTIAKEIKVPLIDIEEAMMNNSEFFYDELHLNPKGQAAASVVISNLLLSIIDKDYEMY